LEYPQLPFRHKTIKKAVFTKHRPMTAFSEMPSGSRVDAQQLSLPNRGAALRMELP
jgi:hypothetical protein